MKAVIIFAAILVLMPMISADIAIKPEPSVNDIKYDKFRAMTSEQIADNLDKIDDLTKIAATKEEAFEKAKEAIKKKYNIELAGLDSGAAVRNNVLTAMRGEKGHVNLADNYYQQGQIKVTSSGEVLFYPDKSSISSPSASDKVKLFVINQDGYNNRVTLKLPNKKSLIVDSGVLGSELVFENGQPYVVQGTFNGVSFTQAYLNKIPLFLGDKIPESAKEFIFMDAESGRLLINAESPTTSFDLRFNKGNPFFSDAENLAFFDVNNLALSIESRSKEKKIPLVSLKLKNTYDAEQNPFVLTNGNFNIEAYANGAGYSKVFDQLSAMPMSFALQDPKGEDLIMRREKPGMLVLDEDSLTVLNIGSGKLESAERNIFLKYNEFMFQFSKDFPNIRIEDHSGSVSRKDIKGLTAILKDLPEKVVKSIKKINVYDKDKPGIKWEHVCGVSWAAACAFQYGHEISVQSKYLSDEVIMSHEAAHVLTHEYEISASNVAEDRLVELRNWRTEMLNEISALEQELWDIKPEDNANLEILRKKIAIASRILGSHIGIVALQPETRTILAKDELKAKLKKSEFTRRWHLLKPDYSLVDKQEFINPNDPSIVSAQFFWDDSEGDASPKYGFVNPYGGQNFYEDIATFVEMAHTRPAFFKPLISQGKPDENIYLRKLGLLYEYGFITPEDYRKVLSFGEQE